MGTVIDRVEVVHGGWRSRHSGLRLAVSVARKCLKEAHCDPDDLDLLVNAGIYRDRNLGEPALAAVIQEDIGANIEDPHPGGHGTFSFDVANGTCGVLTGLQIVDGFLRSHTVERALVVASDADPGHGMSERFPFAAAGGAMLCRWTDDDCGIGRFHWTNHRDGGESFRATVGLRDARNVLRFGQSASMDKQFADAAAEAADGCLRESGLSLSDIDVIVTAPARSGYRAALAALLGVPVGRVAVAGDERMHTAALVAAFGNGSARLPPGTRGLIVAAGAGITAGAVYYREPPGV
jgi:3-oxoacyl-[acyl-carrier-protein] synthase-3